MSYRMTSARRAALRKAQIASARKRKGRGKAPVRKNRVRAVAAASKGVRRRGTAPKSSSSKASVKSRNRKIAKRTAIAVGAIGAAAGAGYVYKHRERLIIKHEAERRAIRDMQRWSKKNRGRKLTKAEKHQVRMDERRLHATRSSLRVREYIASRSHLENAKKAAKAGYAQTTSLRPGRKNNIWDAMSKQGFPVHKDEQRKIFEGYRKDVHSRARSRLAKMQGKKRGFNYDSGKRLLVNSKGRVKQAFW